VKMGRRTGGNEAGDQKSVKLQGVEIYPVCINMYFV